jgi:hypothetical protein
MMGALQAGQGPLIPAIDAGTRSWTPHVGQAKEIRSWLMSGTKTGQRQT